MEKRVPASERTREALRDLIEGRLGSVDAGTKLIRLATRLIIEESLEAEHRDVLGRDYYENVKVLGLKVQVILIESRLTDWQSSSTELTAARPPVSILSTCPWADAVPSSTWNVMPLAAMSRNQSPEKVPT